MIPDYSYLWVWLAIITILCLVHGNKLLRYPTYESLHDRADTGYTPAKILLAFVILFIGTRPISPVFADMEVYAGGYDHYTIDFESNDPAWGAIAYFCRDVLGLSVSMWFLLISAITFTLKLATCRRLFGNTTYTAFLFILTAFSFWSSATVILRSSLATAVAVYAITYFLNKGTINKLIAIALFVVARYLHSSSVLLSGCFLISYFCIRKINWSIAIYVICVALSLALGHYFELFFSSLGFDDRMQNFTTDVDYSGFSHSGFRWDFLLYSLVPIIIGWYLISRQQVKDKIYSYLLNTYILSNAFWVLVIRAQFSDRFAALSWVIYPIVLAYPLLKIPTWKNQPQKVWIGLLGQLLFLWLMQFYYYAIK